MIAWVAKSVNSYRDSIIFGENIEFLKESNASVEGFQTCLLALGAKKVAIKPAIKVDGLPVKYEQQYTKTLFWNMTEYDIVFYMDTEQLLVPNHKMDDLFKLSISII